MCTSFLDSQSAYTVALLTESLSATSATRAAVRPPFPRGDPPPAASQQQTSCDLLLNFGGIGILPPKECASCREDRHRADELVLRIDSEDGVNRVSPRSVMSTRNSYGSDRHVSVAPDDAGPSIPSMTAMRAKLAYGRRLARPCDRIETTHVADASGACRRAQSPETRGRARSSSAPVFFRDPCAPTAGRCPTPPAARASSVPRRRGWARV